jgi:chromosome segregation ATPase
MEELVKFKQAFLPCMIALAVVAGLTGCKKKDDTAVKSLQDLTSELSGQVTERNKELASLAEQHQTCMKDLAKAKNEAMVITVTDASVPVPSLEGEANVASLEALKEALNQASEKQEAALTELKTKNEQCAKDLDAAKAEAEAAEAEAATKAKKKAAPKKPASAEEEPATRHRQRPGGGKDWGKGSK